MPKLAHHSLLPLKNQKTIGTRFALAPKNIEEFVPFKYIAICYFLSNLISGITVLMCIVGENFCTFIFPLSRFALKGCFLKKNFPF